MTPFPVRSTSCHERTAWYGTLPAPDVFLGKRDLTDLDAGRFNIWTERIRPKTPASSSVWEHTKSAFTLWAGFSHTVQLFSCLAGMSCSAFRNGNADGGNPAAHLLLPIIAFKYSRLINFFYCPHITLKEWRFCQVPSHGCWTLSFPHRFAFSLS